MSLMDFAILSFTSVFVIVDPVGMVPVFLSMSHGNSTQDRIRMARLASLTTFFILLASAFLGQGLLHILGVTISAFEIAGGIVLLIIAVDMLQARRTAVKETREETEEGMRKEDIAITPLAVPMLAGPGAITTVILLSNKAHGFFQQGILAGNIALVTLLTYVIFKIASIHAHLFGVIAMKIVRRLMGLLLATIAVQFILNGIQQAGLFR